MQAEEILKAEVQRLHALEAGLVAVFDVLEGQVTSRKAAVSAVMLVEAADRHLVALERICDEAGWDSPMEEPPSVSVWRMEVEQRVLRAPTGCRADVEALALMRRAVYLKVPCYESARLFAFYAERPLVARAMRHALEDENHCLDRLRNAAELGVSLGSVLHGGPFGTL